MSVKLGFNGQQVEKFHLERIVFISEFFYFLLYKEIKFMEIWVFFYHTLKVLFGLHLFVFYIVS